VSIGARDLGGDLRAFHAWQAQRWPLLAQAEAALAGVKTRELRVGDRPITVQWNPGRLRNTTARVDDRGVRQRPCFLCSVNMPAEEWGVPFGEDLVIIANPAPILPLHLVVAHRAHRPQRLAPLLDDAVALAMATAGTLCVFYNGPRCGASAPDHAHLQAVEAGQLPEERQITCRLAGCGRAPVGELLLQRKVLRVWRAVDAGRTLLVLHGLAPQVTAAIRDVVDALAADASDGDEPPLNLLLGAEGVLLTAQLYSRGAHRPACFFAEGAGQRLVSPGALDMAGLVVTVREQDFRALDDGAMTQIYRETSLPVADEQRLVARLRRSWSDV